jgi:uncharacterized protein YjbI with pentapeptide repeats
MRVVKPQRLSILQRSFEVRQQRLLSVAVLAFVPFEAPELPLPEVSLWQLLPRQMGKDVALDEGLPKPRGEILVFGKAFAPGGKPRPAFSVRAGVGPVDKTIYVVGKRRWVLGAPSEPEPLADLLLGWDKAFGGPGFAANPLGMGAAPRPEEGGAVHDLPQLEDPKRLLMSPGDRPTPMAFGPLDPAWPERQARMGTYDDAWLSRDFPGFARDLDPEYFMTAPLDQRLPGYFQGGEPVVLENLHPEESLLTTRVPQLAARCFVTRKNGDTLEEVATRLETLVLLPNARRMVALFRGVASVVEDDASDVTCLLAALERRGAPRPLDHYQSVLARRLDKKKGHLVALRDKDLLPEPDPDAPVLPDETYSDMGDLLHREGVLQRRARERAQRELSDLRMSVRVLGIDPDEKGIPRELPKSEAPPEAPPKLDDLAAHVERVEEEAARIEAEAKAKEKEAVEDARRTLAGQGVDPDEVFARAREEGGGPPPFRASDHLARMRETAEASRKLGAPMEDLEAQIEDPAFAARLRRLEEAQLDGYRKAAHHWPPARIPDDPARLSQRQRVEAALGSGASMAGWDLTGADLRGLDLTNAVLREALLERADLRECTFSGTDLSGAVLTRANLQGARLSDACLEHANLAEILAGGADLRRARLAKAVLYRAALPRARLAGADLRGADLFEARLAGADLEHANADEVLFYACDLEGARLDRGSFRKATFFRCRMAGVSFVAATLEGATLLEVNAEHACFREAHAKNLRLALTCALDGADFSFAELGTATMRGAALERADLTGARAEGCDLSESNLAGACLQHAGLREARLVRADLTGADLSRANLMDALLQGAKVTGASFAGANLFRANLLGAEGDPQTTFEDAHLVRALFRSRDR